jgi:ATP-binding cassette subfamily G (WHITE) protein 1
VKSKPNLSRIIGIGTFLQVLTFTRLTMHFVIALLVGTIFYKIGQDAAYAIDNFNLLFFSMMFLMFSVFNATLITSK